MTLLGTFEDMSLTDLFEIFRMGTKSGILSVEQASLQGTIVVSMGRLIDAEIVQRSNPPLQIATGDDAVIHMLRWHRGEFNFAHDPAVMRHPVTIFCESDHLVQLSKQPADPVAALLPAIPVQPEQPMVDLSLELTFPTELRLPQRRARLAQAGGAQDERRAQACVHSAGLTWLEQRTHDSADNDLAALRPEASSAHKHTQPAPEHLRPGRAYAGPTTTSRSKLLQAVMRRVRSL